MSYKTSRIKDLSIALETMSRLNGCRSEYDRLRDILSGAIDEVKEKQKAKAARSAKSTSHDDIPF